MKRDKEAQCENTENLKDSRSPFMLSAFEALAFPDNHPKKDTPFALFGSYVDVHFGRFTAQILVGQNEVH